MPRSQRMRRERGGASAFDVAPTLVDLVGESPAPGMSGYSLGAQLTTRGSSYTRPTSR